MAINVRFGPAGAALDAAVQAGEGQDFWRRFQGEQQLVRDARQAQAQQDANRLDAQRLQLAAQQSRNAAATPTSTRQTRQQSFDPFKQLGVSGDDRARLELSRQFGGVQAGQQALESVVGPFQPQASGSPMNTAKRAYLAAMSEGIEMSPEQMAALDQMAEAPDVDLDDFQQTVRGVRMAGQARATNRRAERSMRDRQISNEQRRLMGEAERIQRELVDAGVDLEGPPTQFNPDMQTPTAFSHSRGTQAVRGVLPFVSRNEEPGAGGRPDLARKYAHLQQLQQQISELQQQRAALVNPPNRQGGSAQGDIDPQKMSTSDLIRQLTEGE